MVQDRHKGSTKVEQEIIRALSNGDTAHDFECPLTTPFSAFCTTIKFHNIVNRNEGTYNNNNNDRLTACDPGQPG